MLPLGLRNNNPGNIRPSDPPWRGAIGQNGGFVVFDTMENGIRALCRQLIAYYENSAPPHPRYTSFNGTQIDTVEEAIYRWAPPADHNDTNAYVALVCSVLECNKDDRFDFRNQDFLFWMVTAIGEEENGHQAFSNNVTDAQIDSGIIAALKDES